jgi:hypothetical protein
VQVQQAEAGWRELLYEKRAKLRGRVAELDIKHAAARMIQVGSAVPTDLLLMNGLSCGTSRPLQS